MPKRQPVSTSYREMLARTPPKYIIDGKIIYNGAIHTPDFGGTSIRSMVKRMAERLQSQKLGELGVEAFKDWMYRLIWHESMWLATATYDFREILVDRLKEVLRDYPGLTTDKIKLEDALSEELSKLALDGGAWHPSQGRRRRHLSVA